MLVKTIMFGIKDCSHNFASQFDGYLGIQPYSQNYAEKEYNFGFQLKYDGYIDHIIFSLYFKLG